jgi:2-polyprenyl-3-methyl-5-hydroxy-6-metoxy-1,4-benzoquinol methylase
MTCAAHCCAIEETFDHRLAKRELENYRRKGPSPSTERLLAFISEAGIAGASVLDVGGGIGTIAHELLEAGAARATVVDASDAYLAAALDEVQRRGSGAALEILHGDFATLAGDLPSADLVTLDKVVCCYPDMERLLAASTGRARRLYGIVYPRDGWWMRLAIAAENALRVLRRSAFRVYVFRNAAIEAAVQRAGFSLRKRERGLHWVVALFERQAGQ